MENENKSNNSIKGIVHIIFAALCFSLMTLFLKLAGDLPVMEKAFFRNIVAFLITAILLFRSEDKFKIKKQSWRGILLRSIFGTAGLIANFWAVDRIGLADSNMLNKMSPFFAMLMSIFILKEEPDRLEWGALIIAFLGVIFVVKPSGGMASLPAFVGLFGGFAAGTAYTFLRKVTMGGERGPVVVMCFSLFSTIVTFPFLIFGYEPMSLKQLIFMLLAGVAAMGGQMNITAAYTYAPAKEISIFDYSQVLFAALWGILFFAELPDWYSVAGYVIIIGAGIFRWYYILHMKDKNKELKDA